MSETLTRQPEHSPRTVRYPLFVIGLSFLGVLAISFPLLVIQIQSGVTAYLAGESAWSRGQLEAVRYIYAYASNGRQDDLEQARLWLDIPLGDLSARLALDQPVADDEAAYDGFFRGQNHPHDIPKMIWLYKLAHNAPYVNDAIEAWRNSDPYIRELDAILLRLESAWQRGAISLPQRRLLLEQLAATNAELAYHANAFRRAMSRASRALETILSLTSMVFFVLLGGFAVLIIMRLTQNLRQSEFKFRSTFERAAIGILQLDARARVIEANRAACETLAYEMEDIRFKHFSDLLEPTLSDHVSAASAFKPESDNDSHTAEHRMRAGDGSIIWAKLTTSRLQAGRKSGARFIVILEDVSESHRLTEELNYQASHDELTGLINRRAFMKYLEEALHRAQNEHFVHALCFIDLDRFKIVNDTSGHEVGDHLLRQVTGEISRHLRKGDLFARLGGDEFGLILDCCDPESAAEIAETIRNSLTEKPFVWEDRSFSIGCSIGIAPITASSHDALELLRAADSACHLAKEQGRSRVLLAKEDDQALAARRQQMEWLERIRKAIQEERLMLYAQRITALQDEDNLNYEILLRMRNEEGEIVPPGAFLPAAERFGIADLVDRWVIENTFASLKAHSEHLSALHRCHINISGNSFDQEGFAAFVEARLTEAPELAPKICFEITETAAVRNLAEVRQFMTRMESLGCRFALDDFGSGLSSFGYLKQLPVDCLKIDGAFVRNIADNKTDRAMVKAINDIAHTLEKETVAEFAENQASVDILKSLGVDYAQGYHLHRPEPLQTLLDPRNEKRA